MPERFIEIGERRIGPGYPTYVIAEMSANHNRELQQAMRILEAAKEAGVDAVKLQTYTPDTITIDARNQYFRIGQGTIWEGKNLYDLYKEAYTPWEWQPKLKQAADKLGLHLFSTPFDFTAVDFLEGMAVPAYKIASFEIVDIPLLRKVARTGKPMIISTGMATLEETREAVDTVRAEGNDRVALLKCTSAYPAPPDQMNLRTLSDLASRFQVPVGLSDHTMGIAVPVAALALGACIVEKHITLSRAVPGPDSAFSLEPHEFKEMVAEIRVAEEALGRVAYGPNEAEKASTVFRRSLFVVEDVRAGELFTERNVRAIRPGYGLHTRHLEEILGKRAARDIDRGTPLDWSLIS